MLRLGAAYLSERVNRITEVIVAVLMVALVLDVWIGVVDRYWLRWQLPWPETLARYLMIWTALLAVSSGVARREHISLTAFLSTLPAPARRAVLIVIDLLAILLFFYVFWFGLDFAQSGATRQAMIFGTTLEPFYWSIPVSAGLAIIQLVLVLLRDQGNQLEGTRTESAEAEK